MSDRAQRLRQARLYLVCDERPDSFLERALRGGVEIVQLRIKAADDDERIVAVARRYAGPCRAAGALLILNDRPDLVAAAGVDGVHIGQDDGPLGAARDLVGPERLVGLSTHTPEQIDAVPETGVDYIGVGPVHATPTKPGRPAVGLELVGYAAEHATLPFFAIGGINGANVTAVGCVPGAAEGNTASATPAASATGSAPATRVVFLVATEGKASFWRAWGSADGVPTVTVAAWDSELLSSLVPPPQPASARLTPSMIASVRRLIGADVSARLGAGR